MSALAKVTPLRPSAEPVWLSPDQVCERVPGITVTILKSMRAAGTGPAPYKPTGPMGKITLYRADEVDAWVARGRHSTREQS